MRDKKKLLSLQINIINRKKNHKKVISNRATMFFLNKINICVLKFHNDLQTLKSAL